MSDRRYSRAFTKTVVGMVAATFVATTLPAAPAAAEGLLDFLFGGFRRPPSPPTQLNMPTGPLPAPVEGSRPQESVHAGGGSGVYAAYCVRLCDGRYFPMQAHHNVSPAEQCHAECPASATKIFSGSGIDRAVARDGAHYADLPNAFVYRKQIVASCTCNGKTNYSLVHIPLANDPTLRPGDIVATNSGLSVYSGHNGRGADQQADFTPIDSANVSKAVRSQLADVKITPRPPTVTAPETTGAAPDTTSSARDRRKLSGR